MLRISGDRVRGNEIRHLLAVNLLNSIHQDHLTKAARWYPRKFGLRLCNLCQRRARRSTRSTIPVTHASPTGNLPCPTARYISIPLKIIIPRTNLPSSTRLPFSPTSRHLLTFLFLPGLANQVQGPCSRASAFPVAASQVTCLKEDCIMYLSPHLSKGQRRKRIESPFILTALRHIWTWCNMTMRRSNYFKVPCG